MKPSSLQTRMISDMVLKMRNNKNKSTKAKKNKFTGALASNGR